MSFGLWAHRLPVSPFFAESIPGQRPGKDIARVVSRWGHGAVTGWVRVKSSGEKVVGIASGKQCFGRRTIKSDSYPIPIP